MTATAPSDTHFKRPSRLSPAFSLAPRSVSENPQKREGRAPEDEDAFNDLGKRARAENSASVAGPIFVPVVQRRHWCREGQKGTGALRKGASSRPFTQRSSSCVPGLRKVNRPLSRFRLKLLTCQPRESERGLCTGKGPLYAGATRREKMRGQDGSRNQKGKSKVHVKNSNASSSASSLHYKR